MNRIVPTALGLGIFAFLFVEAELAIGGFVAGSHLNPPLVDDGLQGGPLPAYARELLRSLPTVVSVGHPSGSLVFHADGVPLTRQYHPHGPRFLGPDDPMIWFT
jgi:hypothetical protein